jgi:hypothetical protein
MMGIEQMLNKAANNMDEDTVQRMIYNAIDNKVQPHLADIKERFDETEHTREEIAEQLENKPAEQRQEIFHDTMGELIATLALLRLEPIQAGRQLKTMVRDPATLEALALIFDRDAVFPTRDEDEFPECQKHLLRSYLKWIGVAIAPEMYSRDEVKEVIEEFGEVPEEHLDKWDAQNADGATNADGS